MTLDETVRWFVIIILGLTGLSHVAQPALWSAFFVEFLKKPYAGLVIGLFTLPFGLLVVLLHWRWEMQIPVIVTIVGCGWTIKGTLYLIYPQIVQRVARSHVQQPRRFAIAGLFLLAVTAILVVDQLMPKLVVT